MAAGFRDESAAWQMVATSSLRSTRTARPRATQCLGRSKMGRNAIITISTVFCPSLSMRVLTGTRWLILLPTIRIMAPETTIPVSSPLSNTYR